MLKLFFEDNIIFADFNFTNYVNCVKVSNVTLYSVR